MADCILENANQGRICALYVARWDTSCGTATRPKGMVLVHLEENYGRTRLSITIRVVKAYGFALFCKSWVTRCLLIHQPVVCCFVLALDFGFWT